MSEKVAFANEEAAEEDAKAQLNRRGIKLQNKRQSTRQQSKDDFERVADEVVAKNDNQKDRAQKLVTQFWAMMKDTTLESNKGPIQKSLETETIQGLMTLSEELNNDLTKPEGYGSVAMISLLLKTVLHMRNENNQLAYKVAMLEKRSASSNDK